MKRIFLLWWESFYLKGIFYVFLSLGMMNRGLFFEVVCSVFFIDFFYLFILSDLLGQEQDEVRARGSRSVRGGAVRRGK